MKKVYALLVFCLSITLSCIGEWDPISLPNSYIVPCDMPPCGNRGTHVYSLQFPTDRQMWFTPEPDCPRFNAYGKEIYRMTSAKWRSHYIDNVQGISFKGLIYKPKTSNTNKNEFAIFFHEEKCYNGGGEYGWVIYENEIPAYFYLCGDCNIKEPPLQTWYTWPGNLQCINGDCNGVVEALKNPAVYRYWNISALPDGNFSIELVNPVDWSTRHCVIKKPHDFPNLFKKGGYVTINAQKGAETTVYPAPYMHIDEVKVRQ